jgi:hypothetical protein
MEFFKARAAQIVRRSRDPVRCLQLMRSKVEAFVQSGNRCEQPITNQVISPPKLPVGVLVITADQPPTTTEDMAGLETGLEMEVDEEPVQVAASYFFNTKPEKLLEVEYCQMEGFVLALNSDEGRLKVCADVYGRCVSALFRGWLEARAHHGRELLTESVRGEGV